MNPSRPRPPKAASSQRSQAYRYLLVSAALGALIPTLPVSAQTVTEVQVTPETMTLGVGQKQAIFATAFDQRGNLIAAAKFVFWSSDTLIAQVRKDGTVVGLKPGLAKIEARSMGKRASLAVLITGGTSPDPPSTRPASSAAVLTLDPPSANLFPGERVRIVPQGLKDDGTPAPLGRVTWKSLRPDVVKLDTGGYVVGLAPGRTIVQVASGRLMATLPVEVTQAEFVLSSARLLLGPGEVDTIHALIPSQGNREVRGMLQWRSTDSSIVAVSPAGVVSAKAAGQAEIVASGFSQERRATVAVHRVADALVVSPSQSGGPIQVPLRATRQFTAVAEAADSTPISEARVAWELSDTNVASFDPSTGLLTPKALGTTTLTARLAGITPAVWTVQVVAGEISLDPSRVGLLVGQRTTLKPLLRDQAATSSRAAVQWSSDRSDVAAVREGGVVDALSPGRAVITATMPWGKKASADIFVVGDLLLSSNRSGTPGIYQMRAPGPATLLPVLVDSATNIQAALSPDRTRIAFSSNRSGSFDIYLMDPDGQSLRRLTSSPGNEGEPAWTPDGTRIVYTSASGTITQIALISAEGGDSRQLTTGSGGNHSPSVSADGRTIAFVSARDGNHAIYTMGLDGSNQRRLVKSSARQTNPRFFRNGDLAYVVERGGSSKGSRIMRWTPGGGESQLAETEQPVSSLAIARDGDRMAYVVAQLKDSKGRVDSGFFLQSTAPGSRPTVVPLKPGELVLSPSF